MRLVGVRAGIPEPLTRAFFWDLALGHLNLLHLEEASFSLFGFANFSIFMIWIQEWIWLFNYIWSQQKSMDYKFKNH